MSTKEECNRQVPDYEMCQRCEAIDCPERVNEISYEENLANRYAVQEEMLFGFYRNNSL